MLNPLWTFNLYSKSYFSVFGTPKNGVHELAKQNGANIKFGSRCGSLGRVVASDSTGTQFESSHWQSSIFNC